MYVGGIVLRGSLQRGSKWGVPFILWDVFSELEHFMSMRGSCRHDRDLLLESLEYAALRLANADLGNVDGWRWIGHNPRSYIANYFFSKLGAPLSKQAHGAQSFSTDSANSLARFTRDGVPDPSRRSSHIALRVGVGEKRGGNGEHAAVGDLSACMRTPNCRC
jgi:hypothetical protein